MPVMASDYSVYRPDSYKYSPDSGEMTLFILDFSNSMTDYLDGVSQLD